ncbi:MAG: DNA polymerase III subunit gamma/tau [Thermaceae bacterium]|nr:DNA polymerase III subunit gamma/tau [Thermaceae bacterium]
MSALYRQARPTTFEEMVGQEHVKEVLLNALHAGRLAQAYLFSGPRGVGKTSSARLIAQAVNCTSESKPCGVCEGCRLVREGRHPDVLEIDAASNNSVEDVRDLRERILLAPIMSPQDKKVVILDEAHMMSKSAFNALLKTLEEPPQHVIFIFATTEPERMPPTILSRTQHFRFRRLSESEIVQKLSRILLGLERQAEPQALGLVARMADGAMRDAESLLDRLLTLEGIITLAQTEAALGLPPQEALFALAEALDRGQIKEALEQSQQLYTQGFAARTLAQGLLEALRAGMYGRMGLGVGPHLNASEDRLVVAMTALDEALERLLKRSDALSLELAVLAAYQGLHSTPTSPPAIPDFEPKPRRPLERPTASVERQEPVEPSPTPEPQNSTLTDFNQAWRDVLGRLKPTQKAFFREALPYPPEGNRFVLVFTEDKGFHYQNALKHLSAVQQVVHETLGEFEVELRLGGKKK